MRPWGLIFFLLSLVLVLRAQSTSNPFELSPRLTTEDRTATAVAQDTTPGNPFDLKRPGQAKVLDTGTMSVPTNPFDLAAPSPSLAEEKPILAPPTEGEEKPTEKQELQQADSTLLLLTLLLLSILTLCLIFFRTVYQKAYRALFNDNLLSQLYREREAGASGVFLITYSLFFLSGGLFLVLMLRHQGYLSTSASLGQQYLYITLAVTGLITFKHLVLALIGYVFPVQKETSRYSFTIMVFAIVLGFFLTLATIVLAYVPENSRDLVIYISLGVLLLLYLVRTLRGLVIANRFIFNYQFHFLSYICAVEIGPALCLLKFLTDF